MKRVYPIIIKPKENGEMYMTVEIPDFNSGTQGENIADAIEMARDAIGALGIAMEDDKENIPEATNFEDLHVKEGEIKTLVDIDFGEYRRKNDLRTVRKNCTVPSWLSYEAEQANINFSEVLQEGLKKKLGREDYCVAK